MRNWKATMPRTSPPSGSVQMIVAAKSSSGERAEFNCEVRNMKAKLILRLMAMTDAQILAELEGAA